MSINTHLNSLKNYLREELDTKLVRTVDIYAGQFTEAEISQKSFNSPAVFISCLGWRQSRDKEFSNSKRHVEARIVIFVLAKHAKSRIARMEIALAITEEIQYLIINRRIGERCEDFGKTKDFNAENLYGRSIDNQKHALFLLSFWQVVPIQPEVDLELITPELEFTGDLNDEES